MTRDSLEAILNARVYDVAIESPLDEAPILSGRLGNRLLLKREDLQPIFSFKLRGAYNKMARLPAGELGRGVITAAAGNHAQGVAPAGQRVWGAGGDGRAAPPAAPDVSAGQGPIAMEILRQCQEPVHAIFVPVGGGGLIGGIAAYVKRLRPEIRIVGVEPEDADAMHRSLRAGRRVTLSHVGLFADGVAVKQVGSETFRLARRHVDEGVLVDTDELCAAIKDVFEDTRSIAEPAGALGVAGAKRYVEREGGRGRTLVAVLSGANMNFDRPRFVAERAELGEQREVVFAATIPERPGSFRTFCELIGQRNITA